ncbi:hypothetical protein FRACYDRAFT_267288 [Fragilariopsis cylindrus CCMP1102]|uniref:J domain-containing protein n=1 Tax=Fragilariopsis cylindrus CCMP1102 TaxID=635003 RepID=A0A1E7FWH1_9STRA|nr:hypothetical protein FRACYDRAFT_267288 [Fragilariopsis cylindrus CCMP1102]|eukprot:OEU22464.1 hypothetical protein FRACYDRAFT_267288 [Fragilariopsis cylindrus CCMP1102]
MIAARVTKSSLRISFASLRPVTTSNVNIRQIEDIRQQLCLGDNWNTHTTSQKQQQYKYQSTLTRNDDVLGNGSSSIFWQHKRRNDDDDDDDDDDEADHRRNGNYCTRQLRMLSPQPQQQQQLQLQSSQRRMYHTTSSSERAAVLVMGLATLSAVGYAGSSAMKSYNEFKASQPTEEELEEMRRQEEELQQENEQQQEDTAKQQTKAGGTTNTADDDSTTQPRQNIFREWFDVGTKYYDGGFEDTMTRREAALILGVRESSSPARVKDAHRNLLILNHPDTGGSTFLAGKLNEAKELLLKGKSQRKKK